MSLIFLSFVRAIRWHFAAKPTSMSDTDLYFLLSITSTYANFYTVSAFSITDLLMNFHSNFWQRSYKSSPKIIINGLCVWYFSRNGLRIFAINMNKCSFGIVNGSWTAFCMVLKDKLLSCLLFDCFITSPRHWQIFGQLSNALCYIFVLHQSGGIKIQWKARLTCKCYVILSPSRWVMKQYTKVPSVAHLISIQ